MIVTCPHCQEYVHIVEINCAIFRHGVFKHNFEQIPPHSSEGECNRWRESNQIYWCGKPFKLVNGVAIVCEYI